jgi:hypothetical protein
MIKVKNPADVRTIVAATEPTRFRDSSAAIMLKVWFEELDEPVSVVATPFDCERHVKELWIRAMAGEYGPITVLPIDLDGRVPSFLIDVENRATLLLSTTSADMRLARDAAMKQLDPPRGRAQ